MLYGVVVAAYTVANLVLAVVVMFRSSRNQLSRFYFFCVLCLELLSVAGLAAGRFSGGLPFLVPAAVFLYALMPFFFLHFVVLFVRRYEILTARHVIAAIYIVGLLSYALVLLGYIPAPVKPGGEITQSGYVFYLTWMTVYFAIGFALLYESARTSATRKTERTNLLFGCLVLLILLLPGPFTDSIFSNIFRVGPEWYYFSGTFASILAVYFIFRYKILAHTFYDALKSALSVVNDVFVTTDGKFRIEIAQGAVAPLLGYHEEDLLGRPLGDFLEEPQYLEEYRTLVLAGKMKQAYFDAAVVTKDGRRVPVNFSFTPMHFDGEVTGFVGVGRDLTEHRRLEEELRQAQKMESLGTLAGGIAHDFNNILQIILMNSLGIKRALGDAARLDRIMEVNRQAVERGTSLVQQVLTFARKTSVKFEPVDIEAVIREVVGMLRVTFPKTVDIEALLTAGGPVIAADRNQIHQVLLNLCVNARDAMPKGGRLAIGTATLPGEQLRPHFPQAAQADYLRIAVADTGCGIDAATRERIFEPFFTTKEKGKGTGLGLSVVYGIVNAHHGFIDLESEPGRGTEFCIFLPVTKHEEPRIREAGGPSSTARGKGTVLVVEDEVVLLEFLAETLKEGGYGVITATDGAEAVARYRASHRDIALVITDIGLPKIDGWGVLEELKRINPAVKAIVATGYLDPDAIPRNDAKWVISKPYKPDEILSIAHEILRN